MRLSLTAMAVLAVTASALPGIPLRSDTVNSSEIVKTCTNGGRTRDAWKKLDIGSWFVNQTDPVDKFDTDIQAWIQQLGYTPTLTTFHCSPLHECTGSLDFDQCQESEDTARVFFVLDALQNFNNYMISLRDGVVATSGIADSKAASMVEDFTTLPEEKLNEKTSPPIIAGAVFGIVGSILTGPFAGLAALGGGVASLATGWMVNMNENKEELDLEPEFGNFADATKRLGDITETLLKSLEQFAKHVLTDTPVQNEDERIKDDPISAPSILKGGRFAEPLYADTVPGSIYAAMYATTIAALWKAERAFVVRVKPDEPTVETKPCENKELLKDQRWCDDDGNMWLLLHWPEETDLYDGPWTEKTEKKFLDLKGRDKLEDYNLSIQKVVQASVKSFEKNDDKAWKEWDAQAMIDHLTENNGDIGEFIPMNLPYCDLGDYEHVDKDLIKDNTLENDECDDLCQIIYRLNNCPNLYGDKYPPFSYPATEFDYGETDPKYDIGPICISGYIGC